MSESPRARRRRGLVGEPWVPPRFLGHDFDAIIRGTALLEMQDLAERADRDLELVEARLAGRQPLEPEARREDRHEDAVVLVLAGEADQLVREPCDQRQEEDALRDQPVPGRAA